MKKMKKCFAVDCGRIMLWAVTWSLERERLLTFLTFVVVARIQLSLWLATLGRRDHIDWTLPTHHAIRLCCCSAKVH